MADGLMAGPAVSAAFLKHARSGVHIQLALRAVLVAFVVLTLVLVPPANDTAACFAAAGGYAVFAAAVAAWVWRGGPTAVRLAWLALFADVALLGSLSLATGLSSEQSWTADVLANGLFLIPVLAASQLRPGVCAAVVAPTVLVYLGTNIATRSANAEPWESVALRTLVIAGLGAGCIALSHVQRSRVRTIAGLVESRTELLADLLGIEDRERQALAEALHDGALQYILAARQDLPDARGPDASEPLARIDHALTESSQLLRSTVTELHPAVLAQAGLAGAVAALAHGAQARGGFIAVVDTAGWPQDLRTGVDALLYAAARELVGNVAKHAGASRVTVVLALRDGQARLEVADDGGGLDPASLPARLGEGHIGLASQRARIQAAGGRFDVVPVEPHGTAVSIAVPVP
ncbi:sensor histidine kinase [Arthrobacter sp. 35W]|uniref:sensor histidine kinase n=1 Tax=Arthrobacter sp. 35W TaxID=1132441 RepID=UPI00041ABEFE|nr:ATP-binding protein [Arthrobacter sp. 35W]